RRGRKQAFKKEDGEDDRGTEKKRETERKKKSGENKKEEKQEKKELIQKNKEEEQTYLIHNTSSSHPEGKFAHPSTDLLSTAATLDSSSTSHLPPPVLPSSSSSFSSFFFFPSLKSSSSSRLSHNISSCSDPSSTLGKEKRSYPEKDNFLPNATSPADSLSVPKDVGLLPLSSSASSFPSFISTWKRSSSFLFSLSSSSSPLSSSSSSSSRLSDRIGRLQLQQFLLSYTCYSSLYLTRKPFASARTKLLQELSLSTVDLGWVDTSFLFFYALVQLFLSSTVASFFSQKKNTSPSAFERGTSSRKDMTGLKSFFLLSYTLSSFSCLLISLLPLHLLHFSILLVAWGVNGASQALVFPFLVSILRQWLKRMKGGGASAFGVWSTCQQVGSMAASYMTGEILSFFAPSPSSSSFFSSSFSSSPSPLIPSWRLVFFVPSVCVFLCGLLLFFFLIDSPDDHLASLSETQSEKRKKEESEICLDSSAAVSSVSAHSRDEPMNTTIRHRGAPSKRTSPFSSSDEKDQRKRTEKKKEEQKASSSSSSRGGLDVWLKALNCRWIGVLCVAYFSMKLVRYLLMNWMSLILEDFFSLTNKQASWAVIVFETGGVLGAIFVGFLSDRSFDGKRFLLVPPLCFCGCLFFLLFLKFLDCEFSSFTTFFFSLQSLLFLLGACIAGPDSVLGGTAAADTVGDEYERKKLEQEKRQEAVDQEEKMIIEKKGEKDLSGRKEKEKGGEEDRVELQQIMATASCLVNGSGSVGSVVQGRLAPLLRESYGWEGVFFGLGGLSACAAIALLPLFLRDFSRLWEERVLRKGQRSSSEKDSERAKKKIS
ncbi:major facilitator family protein, partial [Cystoisospora suis]